MMCVHLGRVDYDVHPVEGDKFQVFVCSEFGECTLKPSIMMMGDEPMRCCQGCPKFQAAVTDTEKAFNNLPWGTGETASGPGSTLAATAVIREAIPKLLRWTAPYWVATAGDFKVWFKTWVSDGGWAAEMGWENSPASWTGVGPTADDAFHNVIEPALMAIWQVPGQGYASVAAQLARLRDKPIPKPPVILDIPCGDCNWFPDVPGYIGGDIVRELVEQNREKFPNRRFEHLDIITDDLPKADVVFTRDCLVHLPFHEIGQSLKNIVESGAKWLVTTYFPGRANHDIPLGSWRPLDLTAKPFYLPEPLQVINEGLAGDYSDKSLGVWSVDAIRDAVAALNAKPKLTIGMATYRDWPGVWATLEAIEEYHPEVLREIELIVVDNDPQGVPDVHSEDSHSNKCKRHVEALGGRYDHFTAVQGTAAAKGRIFELATAPNVLVIDCHVMLKAGSIRRLIDYFDANPDSRDLLQGPCKNVGTHFAPTWGGMMFGQWANDPRGKGDEPFEIPMQGCGLFACRKAAWPGFHPLLRGFGPEEGHIHARIRKAGGKCLCLPWLRWSHRFGNPGGASPQTTNEDRLRGYLLTWLDSDELCLADIRNQFVGQFVTAKQFDSVLAKTREEFGDTKIRGFGDRLEQVLEATGIAKVAKSVLGEKCGCAQRREALNRLTG